MNVFSRIIISLVLLFSFGASRSQGVAIGDWRDHLPYGKCVAVAQVGNKIYCATPYNLFYYDKIDNSIQRFSTINGLSDFGIKTIRYNEKNDILLIAYKNANVDLLHGNQIVNIPDIKRANLLGNKTINNVLFIDDLAYLSCGFGIVVLDMVKEEIKDSYFIGPQGNQINVSDLAVDDTSFFAATGSGIYTAYRDEPNLADYVSWTRLTDIPYSTGKFNLIEYFNGKILANVFFETPETDTLFAFDGTQWDYFDTVNLALTRNINIAKDHLLISCYEKQLIYDNLFNLKYQIIAPNIYGTAHFLAVRPNFATIDNENFVWIADDRDGLVRILEWYRYAVIIKPEGPPAINVYVMSGTGNSVWVAPGGKTDVWSPVYNNEGVFSFVDENWSEFNGLNTPFMYGIHDFIAIDIDPYDNSHVFAGAFRSEYGMVEIKNSEVVNKYNDENSSLQKWEAAGTIAVTGLDFDYEGNLWVANSGAANVLSVRKPGGEWLSFNLGSSLSGIDIDRLTVDSYGQKWIIKRKTIDNPYYMIVFSDNNTLANINDDKVKGITSSPGSGNIPGNKVLSIAEDQDGELWIGTDDGVAVIYSPENVFSGGNFDAQRIIIPRNDGSGLGDILLENTFISSIAVDGNNNKWIGTDNAGVFLLSADGLNEIYHFTTDDSPLFSNLISSIAINGEGEVFIGTANGIISFRSQSSPPNEEFTDVYAYPNPVREGFAGMIGIKGLVRNTDVKITDISGNLIYETRSQGGQAVWNGRNFTGRPAKSGVYLVFLADEDGKKTMVTKILIIN